MQRLIVISLAIVLTGCATIQEHPTATAIIMGVFATSIALSVNATHNTHDVMAMPKPKRKP